jgi:hypothetical protein
MNYPVIVKYTRRGEVTMVEVHSAEQFDELISSIKSEASDASAYTIFSHHTTMQKTSQWVSTNPLTHEAKQ